ncbi:MAG: hypothetical protein GF401_11000 [Chitinivibrionales bacterium]|nr:hypothetical protein [Chitinivibrionales bacterium]
MKVLTHGLAVILTAAILLALIWMKLPGEINAIIARRQISSLRQCVRQQLEQQKESLADKLTAFAEVTGSDREFAMRLLVENDPSAAEVVERAEQFIRPMGLEILEITDSLFVLISSGHFPASAGNSIAEKITLLESDPAFIMDNILGEEALTLQAKTRFSIAELPFYVAGGLIVDQGFLSMLVPSSNSFVLLKWEDEIIGGEKLGKIESISEIEDNKIIVNNRTFLADTLSLQFSGENASPVLLVLAEEPEPVSILSLFQ